MTIPANGPFFFPLPMLLLCLLSASFWPLHSVLSTQDSSHQSETHFLRDTAEESWPIDAEVEQLLLERKEAEGMGRGDLVEVEGSGEEGEEMPAIEALLDAAKVEDEEEGGGGEAGIVPTGNGTSPELPANGEQKTEHCKPKLDLVFLLDTSGSIEQLYQEHVRWAVSLVESLPLEQDAVRVAAVQFAGFPLTEFALGTYPSAEDIRQHLERVQFQSGVTRTGYALRKAEAELFRPDRGARTDATKVIVLFTDGLSVDDPLKPAQQLRDLKNVKIFVVSIGTDSMGPELNRIAGQEENLFGPDDLPRLREALLTEAERARACSRIGDDAFNGPRGSGNGLGGLAEDRDPVVEALGEEEELAIGHAGGGNGTREEEDGIGKRHGRPMAEQLEGEEEEQDLGDMLGMDEEEEKEEVDTGNELGTPSASTTSHGQIREEKEEEEEQKTVHAVDESVDEREEEEKKEVETETIVEAREIVRLAAIEPVTPSPTSTGHRKANASPVPSPNDGLFTSGPAEERDVFEPVEGLPQPRTRARPLVSISSVTGRPSSPLPRTFPVRVEFPRAFTRRPQLPPTARAHLQAAFPGASSPLEELKGLASASAFKEFPGASISRRLMKTGVTMHIVTAAVATSSLGSRPFTASPYITSSTTSRARSSTSTSPATSSRRTSPSSSTERPRTTTTTASTSRTSASSRSLATSSSTTRAPQSQQRARSFGTQAACPPVDLLFLLDSSGSVHRVYEEQKAWLGQVLEQIQLGGEGEERKGKSVPTNGGHHRVALIQFAGADLQKTEWEWNEFRQNTHMMDTFHQVRHLTGTTYIGQALQHALGLLDARRRQVPTMVVLLSDGFSQDEAVQLAQTMRKLPNLQFFALSIGQFSNTELLHRLVGDPSHVFIGHQAGELLRAQLLRRIQCR